VILSRNSLEGATMSVSALFYLPILSTFREIWRDGEKFIYFGEN
jgi:hypothetical protein